ncbi:hypothetical protein HAX54_053025, partial [Datura stramonium]|nr:hypothetical protein [Datura stramonium]
EPKVSQIAPRRVPGNCTYPLFCIRVAPGVVLLSKLECDHKVCVNALIVHADLGMVKKWVVCEVKILGLNQWLKLKVLPRDLTTHVTTRDATQRVVASSQRQRLVWSTVVYTIWRKIDDDRVNEVIWFDDLIILCLAPKNS